MVCQPSMQHCITWMYILCTRVRFIPYIREFHLPFTSRARRTSKRAIILRVIVRNRQATVSLSLSLALESRSFERSCERSWKEIWILILYRSKGFRGFHDYNIICVSYKSEVWICESFEVWTKIQEVSRLFSRKDRRKELIFKGYWKSMWPRGMETRCSKLPWSRPFLRFFLLEKRGRDTKLKRLVCRSVIHQVVKRK